jgi:AraC-like DNA-binding protein
MRTEPAPLLEALGVFRTRDADAIRDFLGEIGFALSLDRQGAGSAVDVRLNGAYFPSLWVGYTQYGAAVTVKTEARSDFWLQVPLRGGIEAIAAGESICCDARTAVISSPVGRREIRTDPGSARLQVSLVGDAMHRQLAALLGDWPREPLVFTPSLDLTQGCGRSLLGYLHGAAEEFDAHGHVTWSPLVISQFEQLVMTRLLLEHPHNYADAVRRRDRLLSPRGVKRAIDFIDANLDAPITVTDLVAVSGIAGRTLFENFRAFKGVSPMRYLRERRFEQARRALMSPLPDENVTSIAVRWGFNHMGRFATNYCARFGETPSATLGRARRAFGDERYLRAMAAQRRNASRDTPH